MSDFPQNFPQWQRRKRTSGAFPRALGNYVLWICNIKTPRVSDTDKIHLIVKPTQRFQKKQIVMSRHKWPVIGLLAC